VRAGTGAGAGTGTGTGYVGGLACGLQVLHVLRPGVAFGNAVETLGFDWPRCADSDEHSPYSPLTALTPAAVVPSSNHAGPVCLSL
jgi:hypothetical protein